MAVFYHVSTDLSHDGVFVPRIPQNRHQQAEDATIPRISVAPTLEHCLTAIPGRGINLDELNIENRGYYLVFRIDTEKLGISDNNIVTWKTLFEKDWVRDAEITEEHWTTVPFTVPQEDRFLIKLISWEETCADVIPYFIYQIADEKYDGNYLEAYMEELGEAVPSTIVIEDAIYVHEQVKEGDEVALYFDTEDEKKALLHYLSEHYQVESLNEMIDEIVFRMKTESNLRNLFLHHAQIAMMNY